MLPGLTVEPGLPSGAVTIPIVEDLARVINLAWSAERTRSFALDRLIETTESVVSTIGWCHGVDRFGETGRSAVSKAVRFDG